VSLAKEYHPLPCHTRGDNLMKSDGTTTQSADYLHSQKSFRKAMKTTLRERGQWSPLADADGTVLGGVRTRECLRPSDARLVDERTRAD
jgi:hypothetical protein